VPDLPTQPSQEKVVRALVRAGGVVSTKRGKGSHIAVTIPDVARPVIVPTHIGPHLLASIIKQANLTREQFLEAY
jgi:predicted RNA binding protein YcfA (HicA-like mRNA interferase family)